MSARRRLVESALRRGINPVIIAEQLGVSHQAISQMVQRMERSAGVSIPRPPKKMRVSKAYQTLHEFVCGTCGRSFAEFHSSKKMFCSRPCARKSQRTISDDMTKRAMEMRVAGQTWKNTAKLLGHPTQSLQRRIWDFLHGNGILTRQLVVRIWRPSGSLHRKTSSWQWLIGITGNVPREDEAGYAVYPLDQLSWMRGPQIKQENIGDAA